MKEDNKIIKCKPSQCGTFSIGPLLNLVTFFKISFTKYLNTLLFKPSHDNRNTINKKYLTTENGKLFTHTQAHLCHRGSTGKRRREFNIVYNMYGM